MAPDLGVLPAPAVDKRRDDDNEGPMGALNRAIHWLPMVLLIGVVIWCWVDAFAKP